MVGHVNSVQYLEGDCCLWSWDSIPQIKSLVPWNLSWGCDWTIVHQTCTSPREIVSYRVGYLEGWQPCFQVYGVYSLTTSYPFKRGNENGAFQVCICSFMKCHPENWSNPASTLLLLHFQMTSSSLEWNSGLVIIASRGNDVLSFCLFFFFTSWHFNKSNHTWTNWLVPLVLQTSNSQFLVHHKIWAEDLYSAFSSHVRKHKDSLISSSSCVL